MLYFTALDEAGKEHHLRPMRVEGDSSDKYILADVPIALPKGGYSLFASTTKGGREIPLGDLNVSPPTTKRQPPLAEPAAVNLGDVSVDDDKPAPIAKREVQLAKPPKPAHEARDPGFADALSRLMAGEGAKPPSVRKAVPASTERDPLSKLLRLP